MNIDEKLGLNKTTPFSEKYKKLIDYLGEENVRFYIPFLPEILAIHYQRDEHFNTLPIKKWDLAAGFDSRTSIRTGYGVSQLLLKNGINAFSHAECVCLLKEAAKYWALEELNKDTQVER